MTLPATMKTMKQVGKIFGISNSLPQRPELSFTCDEVLDDVKFISNNEEHINKLYLCVNEKPPPQERKYAKIEEFLKDSRELEEVSGTLESLADEISLLQKSLLVNTKKLKEDAEKTLTKK